MGVGWLAATARGTDIAENQPTDPTTQEMRRT